MDNRSYSRYRNIKSIIHFIDPVTKLLAFILLTTSIFMINSWLTLVVVITFIFFVSIMARVRIKSYFTMLFFIIPFFAMMTLFYWIAYFDINYVLKLVSFMSIRMYGFLLVAIIYTSTTKEIDIATSIEWYITPLKFIKVPTYEISMIITLAIRFIPLMFEDLRMIMIAQTSRGVNIYNGKLLVRIKGLINSILPMLVLSFKRSEDIANAMVIRGYEIGKKRTKFKKNKFGWIELLTLIIMSLFLILLIYLGGL